MEQLQETTFYRTLSYNIHHNLEYTTGHRDRFIVPQGMLNPQELVPLK